MTPHVHQHHALYLQQQRLHYRCVDGGDYMWATGGAVDMKELIRSAYAV